MTARTMGADQHSASHWRVHPRRRDRQQVNEGGGYCLVAMNCPMDRAREMLFLSVRLRILELNVGSGDGHGVQSLAKSSML
jgi:hypothetical protein